MENWIDILSEAAVTLAAHAWGKGKAETWSIISHHIDGGNFRQRMTLYQFQANVKLIADPTFFHQCPVCKTTHHISDLSCTNCHVDLNIARRHLIEEEFKNFPIPLAPTPPPVLPTKQTIHTDEKWIAHLKEKTVNPPNVNFTPSPSALPTQPNPKPEVKTKKKLPFALIASALLLAFCFFLVVVGIMSSFSSPSRPVIPSPIFNVTAWEATVIVMRTQKACTDDAMYGVPDEYSRCNPNHQTEPPDEPYYFNEEPTDSPTSCLIKGNISFDTGEKIYHLPGQKSYETTTIDPSYGERWFCTEAEAQAAGWRKAYE